jgi:hypothetical protein
MRYRKQTSAVYACLALIGVLSCFCCGCGDDGTGQPPKGSSAQLEFTREDGSAVEFSGDAELYVWCGAWEPDVVPVPSLHVWFGSTSEVGPTWRLSAVVGDIGIGDTLFFPNYFIWDQPDSVLLGLFDPPNELATDTEGSSGTIVFERIPCLDGDVVEFSIDAVIGSEYGDMPWVAVSGHFVARVTSPFPGTSTLFAYPRAWEGNSGPQSGE